MPPASPPVSAPASGYAPPATATSWKAGRFTGTDFPLQPDGTLRCPAGNVLVPHEHRRERDGSLRVVYSASIRDCRPCPLREQCQWNGSATAKPRQVSVLLHPLVVGPAPLRLRGTGTGDTSDRRACTCTVTAWTSRWGQISLPLRPFPLRSSLGPSVRTTACPGRSGLFATLVPTRLVSVPSSCVVSRKALPPGSV